MFGIGGSEVLVILLVALLLFGAKRLPELARSLGRSLNEFKRGVHSTVAELELDEGKSPREKAEFKKAEEAAQK